MGRDWMRQGKGGAQGWAVENRGGVEGGAMGMGRDWMRQGRGVLEGPCEGVARADVSVGHVGGAEAAAPWSRMCQDGCRCCCVGASSQPPSRFRAALEEPEPWGRGANAASRGASASLQRAGEGLGWGGGRRLDRAQLEVNGSVSGEPPGTWGGGAGGSGGSLRGRAGQATTMSADVAPHLHRLSGQLCEPWPLWSRCGVMLKGWRKSQTCNSLESRNISGISFTV